ncbi:unnamed protein product [Ostreobium quekettii]|uniref:Uncharacterized protein n=1 Tax=Ostreobium quekettii TaxID=121088 RepID=A0A8S1JCG6_9CHLO|nr:unnamed protein product [Ostreobium quekettii]
MQRWQVERETWSRHVQRLYDDVESRLNEVDRLRAEANALLAAARTEAGAVVRKEMSSINARVDDLHRQTAHIKKDLQSTLHDVSTSLGACEKMTVIQCQVCELQRWREASLPDSLAQTMSHTVEDMITEQQERLMEQFAPRELEERLNRIKEESHAAAVALANDISTLAEDLQSVHRDSQRAFESTGYQFDSLGVRITRMERNDPSQRIEAVQEKLELIVKQQAMHDDSVEGILRSILSDLTKLSEKVKELGTCMEDLSERVEGDREFTRMSFQGCVGGRHPARERGTRSHDT